MVNIKILTFIIIIILLIVVYFYFNTIENFSSQNCKEFSNVNLVFHKLDFEPKIGSRTLFNYVNEDFIILTNSDYTEFLDSDDLNYTNLITYGDIESYFLESTNIDLENLMIE